jgi:hypothetical protein
MPRPNRLVLPSKRTTTTSNGMRLPGVTPVPVAVDGRLARREAALRVLAELAAEDAEPTPRRCRRASRIGGLPFLPRLV